MRIRSVLLLVVLLFLSLHGLEASSSPLAIDSTFRTSGIDSLHLQIKKRTDGSVRETISVGDEIAFWINSNQEKRVGMVEKISAESLVIDGIDYPLSSISVISPGRAIAGKRFLNVLGGIVALIGGFLLATLITFNAASSILLLLVYSPFVFLGFLSLRSPRRFKRKKFDFIVD
ncbi:MAG: hypothetical protein AAF824_09190 [Bacteroidota bacterium]